MTKATTDWGFDKSDHAAVKIEWCIPNEPTRGQGIVKVNTQILEEPAGLKKVETELTLMLLQIPDDWDDHQRLEYLKMSIRSVMSQQNGICNTEIRERIIELEDSLNNMEELKIKVNKESRIDEPEIETRRRKSLIDNAIAAIKSELDCFRTKMAKDVDFRTKANWYENGEKPTKYFLNLNKHYQKQRLITEINDGTSNYKGSTNVIKGIRSFYESLYKNNNTESINSTDESFFNECPKLKTVSSNEIDSEVTKDELHKALLSCKNSAPGPDGIPYLVYRKLWHITGDYIHKAWLHSVKHNKLPQSHIESVITLLPKEGKDLKEIKNWRPITLSNCDAKLITKKL
jgi:hypothetical protein